MGARTPSDLLALIAERRRTRPVEERLRITGTPTLALSAWRGRSGRRYVVGVHMCSCPDLVEHDDAVLIAVRRDADGISDLVDLASCPGCPIAEWIERSVRAGANEIHVHRLALDEAERAAVIADLSPIATSEAA